MIKRNVGSLIPESLHIWHKHNKETPILLINALHSISVLLNEYSRAVDSKND